MDIIKLNEALDLFIQKKKQNPDHFNSDAKERSDRIAYYQAFTADKIRDMTPENMYEYFGKLWSMLIWGNKEYVVDKIIEDNGLETLKESLIELLYGSKPVEVRWTKILSTIKGLGPATISELLAYSNPNENAIFNKRTVDCFTYLGIEKMPVYTYQYTGKKYLEVCSITKEISKTMQAKGLTDTNLLSVDYFLWDEVLPLISKKQVPQISITPPEQGVSNGGVGQSLHNEIRDKIVEIGMMLGFESEKEILVSSGAKVDAVWEASIGNMGKVIYVFEVQTKGSIDSLVLNLLKAKNNPAVQAVIAVSDEQQLEKIKRESDGISLSDLKVWDQQDVLEVYDALSKAHASINKIGLVPDSFSQTK